MTAEMCGEAAAGEGLEDMRAMRIRRRRWRRVPMAARGLVFAVVMVAAAEVGGRLGGVREKKTCAVEGKLASSRARDGFDRMQIRGVFGY
jgi:CHAD domain-containing protein